MGRKEENAHADVGPQSGHCFPGNPAGSILSWTIIPIASAVQEVIALSLLTLTFTATSPVFIDIGSDTNASTCASTFDSGSRF